jgi:hypothetical protein
MKSHHHQPSGISLVNRAKSRNDFERNREISTIVFGYRADLLPFSLPGETDTSLATWKAIALTENCRGLWGIW